MAQQAQIQQPPAADPDNIPETLCDGQFNLSGTGALATLTFTHVRPDATQMFANAAFVPTTIVRARIVLPWQNLTALRDFLNANVGDVTPPESPTPATGGATKH
jgi:hypothetical protein